MSKLILVRHGSTNLNAENKNIDRIRGWLNIPLNEDGIKDAQLTSEKLRNEPFDVIYSSDLIRAEQTAIIVNYKHDVDIYKTPLLRPWNLGIYEGQITNKVLPALKHLTVNEKIVPKDGENFKTFRVRFLSFIRQLIEKAKDEELVITVTSHYRNLKVFEAWYANNMPEDYTIDLKTLFQDNVSPGDIIELHLDKMKLKKISID